MQEEQPLQVARCTKIIQDEKNSEKSKYIINVKQIAKFVVNLGERVSPTDIEEGMRVGCVYTLREFKLEDLHIDAISTALTGTSTKYYYLYRRRSILA